MSNQSFNEKVAKPYAEALIEHAKNINLLSQVTIELSSISAVLSESRDLEIFLLNPLINNSIKKTVLRKLFQNQVNDFIVNFLLVLVDRRRIAFLSSIIDKYLELTYQLESLTIAELYSVVDINETQQNNLIQKVKAMTNSQKVKLVMNKDPNLIGGFVIKIGSKIIDASLAGRLKKISLYLENN